MATNPRFKLKAYKERTASAPRQLDVLKWFAFGISILGIQAWIAGAAFESGYWANYGLDGPFISKSLQQTALQGFIGPFEVWLYAALFAVVVGALLMIMAINKKKTDKPAPGWVIALREKLKSKFEYDKKLGLVGFRIILGGYVFLFFIVLPLILWSLLAYYEGKNLFKVEVCKIRSGTSINTQINLKNEKIIAGRIIDRSEKYFAMNDGFSLHIFNNGENPSLAYSITLPKIECSN